MKHTMSCLPNHRSLDERMRVLEDMMRRSAGTSEPMVCRVCDSQLADGLYECLCGADEYLPLGAVLAEVRLGMYDDVQAAHVGSGEAEAA